MFRELEGLYVMLVGPSCWGKGAPDEDTDNVLAEAMTNAAEAYERTWGTVREDDPDPYGNKPEPVFGVFVSTEDININAMGSVSASAEEEDPEEAPVFLELGRLWIEPGTDFTEEQEGTDAEFANLK